MKLKFIAAALAIGLSAQANADVALPSTGNGSLFLSIWDTNGSYTLDLSKTINAFDADVAAAGNLNLSWAFDSTYQSFIAGVADLSALKYNIVAADSQGQNRILTTYNGSLPVPGVGNKQNDEMRTAAGIKTSDFLNAVNPLMANVPGSSIAVDSTSPAFAGKAAWGQNFGGLMGFSNAGTFANDSYANGTGFMRIEALATGIALPNHINYADGGYNVKTWIDANGFHIAAVPEPEAYAMFLAGLGMVGAIARRRRNAV